MPMTITFGAAEGFGALSGWEAQNTTVNITSDRANALGHLGDEIASQLHDEKTETTSTYEASAVSGVAILPVKIGDLVDGIVLTGIEVSTSATGLATCSLSGHNHSDNAHSTTRSVAHGIAATVGFGAVDFLGGTAGANADVESSTLSITCQHVDGVDKDGDHSAGSNFDARITATVIWNGVPTTAVGAGWDTTSVTTETTSTGHLKTTATAEKALTLSAEA